MKCNEALSRLMVDEDIWSIIYRAEWTSPDKLGKDIDYLYVDWEDHKVYSNVQGVNDKHPKCSADNFCLTGTDLNADDWCYLEGGFNGVAHR